MSMIKTVLVAVSLVAAAATANAQSREALNTGIHGESAASLQFSGNAPRPVISQEARAAYARAGAVQVRPQIQRHDANPLIDDFHGNSER